MLKSPYVILGLAILFAMFGDSLGQSQPKPQPQNKPGALSTQQGTTQPSTTVNPLTPEQIEKAISDGVNAAAKQYETRHPASPPDNSGWWFNFLLVAFTGGLVAVGAGQCFLFFWTLKATQTAAEAALHQARVLAAAEGPIPLIHSMKLVQYQKIPGEIPSADPFPPGPIGPNCRFIFAIENKGRTPLRMIEICVEKFAGSVLPNKPIYVHAEPWGLILEKGPTWVRLSEDQGNITPADVGAAAAVYPNGAFWVFIYLGYLNLLDEKVTYKFLVRWDLTYGFVRENRPGYT